MSMHSKAYIFRQQQLLVDEHFQLPQVAKLQHDLNSDGKWPRSLLGI